MSYTVLYTVSDTHARFLCSFKGVSPFGGGSVVNIPDDGADGLIILVIIGKIGIRDRPITSPTDRYLPD